MAEETIHRMTASLLKIAGGVASRRFRHRRAQSPGPTTHLLKTVGGCQIKADVYQPPRAATSRPWCGSMAGP